MSEALVLIIIGALFIILGPGVIIYSLNEKRRYFDSFIHAYDVREFVKPSPAGYEPGSAKTGGMIILGIGVIMLIVGLILL